MSKSKQNQGPTAAAAHKMDLDLTTPRVTIILTPEQYAKFQTAIDAPPADNPRFRALLARKPIWEA